MRTRAIRALLDLIADADSVGSVDTYRAALLVAFGAVVPCDVLVFDEFRVATPNGAATPAVTCTTSPPLEPANSIPPALLGAFVRNMVEHPLIRVHAIGDCTAYRLSDVTSMRSFRRLALYGEFFRGAAIEHQLSLGLEAPPDRLTGITANRTRHEFSEDELVLAELLRPHLRAADLAARRAVARTTLTPREREVLDMVASGATNAAVADALVVSPATVKKHLDNIYARLNVGSRAAAAELAGTTSGAPRA